MPEAAKKRARRVASDEAHAWARNLRLGNAHAKYVLCMLTLYVNGDGMCFVSIPQLADDCELAGETIRRRLAWLEEVGAIARRSQWIDESGRRNSEGRGRRTSDEIMLLLDADCDDIEAKASGSGGPSDPVPQIGSNDDAAGACPSADPPAGTPLTPSLQTGAESSEPEPEKEDTPLPPKGGVPAFDEEGWSTFETAWVEPILRQSLARDEWSKLGGAEKASAIKAARGYVAWRKGQKKPPNVLNAHSFLREREAWPRFAEIAAGASSGGGDLKKYGRDSPEFKAVAVAYQLAGKAHALTGFMRSNDGGIHYRGEVTPQLLALAKAPPFDQWRVLEYQQAGAWNGFLEKAVTTAVWTRLSAGSKAPWPWPPRKDGSLSETAPDIGCSDDELADFK